MSINLRRVVIHLVPLQTPCQPALSHTHSCPFSFSNSSFHFAVHDLLRTNVNARTYPKQCVSIVDTSFFAPDRDDRPPLQAGTLGRWHVDWKRHGALEGRIARKPAEANTCMSELGSGRCFCVVLVLFLSLIPSGRCMRSLEASFAALLGGCKHSHPNKMRRGSMATHLGLISASSKAMPLLAEPSTKLGEGSGAAFLPQGGVELRKTMLAEQLIEPEVVQKLMRVGRFVAKQA